MPLVDLYGHEALRDLLSRSANAGTLPASLLLQGPRGTGKQRLALWLGQLLLCDSPLRPCGRCQNCQYTRNLTHPDLHWYFPRPKLKDPDPQLSDVRDDYRETIVERLADGGLYGAAPGSHGIYIATVRAILHDAARAPAIARRKVFVIGDAERMVPQEGSEFAANAFLKLLEEPLENTTLVLTSSEPGLLLPTIRSRAVGVRVLPLADKALRAFLADASVIEALGEAGSSASMDQRVQLAAGAPGTLIGDDARVSAMLAARKLIDAATSPRASAQHAAALGVGATGARGAFSDTLDSMLLLLAERMRAALHDNDERGALAASRASDAVGRAQTRASGNVNPMLITSRLLRELAKELS